MFKKMNMGIVCFGGEDWWYHNRGHIDFQLMRRFAEYCTVLYINSIVMQKPKLSQGSDFLKKVIRKSKSMLNGLQKTDAGFYVFSPLSIPLHHINEARKFNDFLVGLQSALVCEKLKIHKPIVWVACPPAANIALNMQKSSLIYQRTDKFEDFPNIDANIIKKYDLKLKKTADITFFVNENLYNNEAGECKKAVLIDHGVDFESFASAENIEHVPEDIKKIPKPIAGFFGGMDSHTFDMDFMEKTIEAAGDISFVFIGKCSIDCKNILSKSNVHMLGQKPYEQIPHYGKCFDVAIMPWKQNKWIEACNPIKLKEYLALGKPVVSTPFPVLDKYQSIVYTANTPQDFAQCIFKAINENDHIKKSFRRQTVQGETWEKKAQLVLETLCMKDAQNEVHSDFVNKGTI
ncbi:MAG: glycosyltransferase [Phycisphaerales bacterium]